MEVIILEDIGKLGKAGDIVRVKDGYARNYLVPQKKAIPCTKGNKKMIEEQKKILARKRKKEVSKFRELADKINSFSCSIKVQVGEDEKLYGSVTNADIQKTLANEGIDIDKRKIKLEEPIKNLGVYNVDIHLHPEVSAVLKVWVVKE